MDLVRVRRGEWGRECVDLVRVRRGGWGGVEGVRGSSESEKGWMGRGEGIGRGGWEGGAWI